MTPKQSGGYPRVYQVDIGQLLTAPWNYKSGGSKDQREKLRNSMKRDKSAGVLAVRHLPKTDKLEVMDGNHRLEDARLLGWKRIWVEDFGPISKAEAITIARRRNKEWFSDAGDNLQTLLKRYVIPEIPVAELATFMPDSERDLAKLLEDLTPAAPSAEDDVPGPGKGRTRTKPGQIWELGEHRVMCGDSTRADHMAKLMDGHKASCVFTDPPYGVSYQAKSGKHAKIKGDDRRDDALIRLLQPAFKLAAAHSEDQAAFYIWHASSTRADFDRALMAAGLEEKQYLIWAKPQIVLGWGDYRWAHEPCYYASKAGQKAAFYGGRDQGTMWRVGFRRGGHSAIVIGPGLILSDGHGNQLAVSAKAPKKKLRLVRVAEGESVLLEPDMADGSVWEVQRDSGAEHPTQKPVELARRACENSTKPGEIVLDTFLGSGSTLIGAESTGRRCYGMEKDRHYCDVIVGRWERTTGQKAKT